MKSMALVAVICCLASNATQAAQFRFTDNPRFRDDKTTVMVEMAGEIQPRDVETLKRLIEPYISDANQLRIIQLNSRGGDVATAMKIGRYLRFLEFDTAVRPEARCLSSCVFILAAGLDKIVPGHNLVGIHRPFGTTTGSISREEATKTYRELTAQIYAYFDEMNIPRRLPEEMLRIPPEQMKMLSFEETEQFALAGKDPVAQERDDAAGAKRFGISRQDYLVRRSRALQACTRPAPKLFDIDCYNEILSGRR